MSLIAIEQAARALRAASAAELYGLTFASSHAVRVRLLVIDACEAWARDLGRVALFATEVANERAGGSGAERRRAHPSERRRAYRRHRRPWA